MKTERSCYVFIEKPLFLFDLWKEEFFEDRNRLIFSKVGICLNVSCILFNNNTFLIKDFLNERLESDIKLYNKYATYIMINNHYHVFAFFVIFPENIYFQQ